MHRFRLGLIAIGFMILIITLSVLMRNQDKPSIPPRPTPTPDFQLLLRAKLATDWQRTLQAGGCAGCQVRAEGKDMVLSEVNAAPSVIAKEILRKNTVLHLRKIGVERLRIQQIGGETEFAYPVE